MPLCIIMYHYVREIKRSRYPAIKGLDVDKFRQQLDFLNERFTIVRMEDILKALEGGDLPENAALLTFDDGYIDHYTTVFPLLDKMGVQGLFFPPSMILETECLMDVNKIHFILASTNPGVIYTSLLNEIEFHRGVEYFLPDTSTLINEYAKPNRFDTGEVNFIKRMLQTALPEELRKDITDRLFTRFVGVDESVFSKELYCDAAQFLTMKKHGMFIGLQGGKHGWLGNMDKDEYEYDISHSLDYMNSIGLIDKSGWVMNYPYGSWNDGILSFIDDKQCLIGLTTDIGVFKPFINDSSPYANFLLPRLDANDFPPVSEKYLDFI